MLDINLISWVRVQQKVIIVVTNSAKFFFYFFFYYVRNSVNLQKKSFENQQPAIQKSS